MWALWNFLRFWGEDKNHKEEVEVEKNGVDRIDVCVRESENEKVYQMMDKVYCHFDYQLTQTLVNGMMECLK